MKAGWWDAPFALRILAETFKQDIGSKKPNWRDGLTWINLLKELQCSDFNGDIWWTHPFSPNIPLKNKSGKHLTQYNSNIYSSDSMRSDVI